MKKGIMFSIDAIVAAGLIITIAIFLSGLSFTYSTPELRYQRFYFASKDMMNVIKEVKFGNVNSSYAQELVSQGIILPEDLDKSFLEVVGSLWVSDNQTHKDYARNITEELLSRTFPSELGYEILLNGQSIFMKNDSQELYKARASTIVSGYETGKPVTGYAGRAYLSTIRGKIVTKIFAMNIGATGYSHGDYWRHGYAPPDSVYDGPGERGSANETLKFQLPDDAVVHEAILTKSVCGATAIHEVSVNDEWSSGILADEISVFNVTDHIHSGWNYIKLWMTDYDSVNQRYIYRDIAHDHPGNFIKVTYETQDLGEGNADVKRFYGDDSLGTPATYQNIPFFVPGDSLDYVQAKVNVKGLNSVSYIALNYKFNVSDPEQGVILSKNFTDTNDKDIIYDINITSSGTSIRECMIEQNMTTIFSESFASGAGGFTYQDDLYQGTNNPGEEDGNWETNGNCASGGCLHVDLNTNPDSSGPWSGGWTRSFTVSDSPSSVRITFYWYDYITPQAESNEYVRIYARDVSDSSEIMVDQTHGDQNSDSGTYSYTVSLPNGVYNLDVGCWQSDVNRNDEQAECWIDDVVVEAIYPSTEVTCNDLPVNTDITTSDIYIDRTNVLGLYFDVRQPRRYDPSDPDHPDNHPDGCESACTSDLTQTETDHYTYLGSASFASDDASGTLQIYSDPENDTENSTYVEVVFSGGRGLEYGYVTISRTYPFTIVLGDDRPGTPYMAGTEAEFNALDFDIMGARVLGVQGPWGGRDNGYNFVFIQPEGEAEQLVLDANQPPGTITYIPVQYLEKGKKNYVRVYDVQSDRELDITRSYVELTYLIEMAVPYGDVFPRARGSTNTVYYDLDNDGTSDGSTQISIGPEPTDMFDPMNDSIDDALARLLDQLNFIGDANPGSYGDGTVGNPYDGIDSTNPIDLDVGSQVTIATGFTEGVPSLWGPAVLEIRVWR
jgi:hypothetical protein